ncbi:large ribosomal subunit protein mL53 [Trichomonascus vanleenenianus]|uniref:mitochondrial 54S ribosomal protein mL53 MRPL44 n=1 Tax=Trichomonascus vanleenenianus TaxID=2268995 RepID=UPI003ECB29F7
MLTKYFSEVTVKFHPAVKSARLARIFLSSLPPKSRNEIKVTQKLLPNESDKPEIKVVFKDGKTLSVDPSTVGNTHDMTQVFEQYSRSLKIKQDISDA